jgi:hypothetical protein
MSELTISQALRAIARLKGNLTKYKERAFEGVTYRLDAVPAYRFSDMMEKIDTARGDLVLLEARVAITNATTKIAFDGKQLTLTQALKQLQEFKDELAWLATLPVRPGETTKSYENVHRAGGYETVAVDYKCDFPEARRSDRIDVVQAKFDALNDALERKNHETPLQQA